MLKNQFFMDLKTCIDKHDNKGGLKSRTKSFRKILNLIIFSKKQLLNIQLRLVCCDQSLQLIKLLTTNRPCLFSLKIIILAIKLFGTPIVKQINNFVVCLRCFIFINFYMYIKVWFYWYNLFRKWIIMVCSFYLKKKSFRSNF